MIQTFAYGDLRGITDETDPALGGNVDHGDPYTFAPSVWDYLVHRFAVRSVLDVGAGQGHTAAYFHRRHGCAVVAIDGLVVEQRAVFPIVTWDLREGPFTVAVDLVHCAEVVEHIEPDCAQHVIDTLACGRVIAMTHATPGQQGYHHVNCQPAEYWIARLRDAGYTCSSIDSERVRFFAARDNAVHFQKGLVFIRT